jgi:hypothetical protein
MKNPLAFLVLGVAIGAAGYYLVDRFASTGGPGGAAGPAAGSTAATPVLAGEPAAAAVARLEEENARLRQQLGSGAAATAPAAGAEPESGSEAADQGSAMLEFMMRMGGEQVKRGVEPALKQIAERLSLSPDQEELVRTALLDRVDARMAVGPLMLQGKASLADMLKADDDNYTAFDAAMADILTADQLVEYAEVQDEREFARIEKKTKQDLEGLASIADLTPEQKEEAFAIFAEINATEAPGQIPADLTFDQFEQYVDGAVQNRIDRLRPILENEEISAYQTQAHGFRDVVVNMIGRATGAIAPDGSR